MSDNITCAQFTELLVAPHEAYAPHQGKLAAHVEQCEACRAIADAAEGDFQQMFNGLRQPIILEKPRSVGEQEHFEAEQWAAIQKRLEGLKSDE